LADRKVVDHTRTPMIPGPHCDKSRRPFLGPSEFFPKPDMVDVRERADWKGDGPWRSSPVTWTEFACLDTCSTEAREAESVLELRG
jgi:hypothetical protein